VQSAGLSQKIGPRLAELCGVGPHDADPTARRKILALVNSLANALTELERTAIRHALGDGRGVEHDKLEDRVRLLAQTLVVSHRTARRRVDEAFRALADEAVQASGTATEDPADPERGWAVLSLESLLRLDLRSPQIIETRRIVALRDGLKKITARVSLPLATSGLPDDRELEADAQQGARISSTQRQGQSHYRYVLDLPRALGRGDEHSYTLVFQVPEGRLRPHYAFIPLVACRRFDLRVRFDPERRPRQVWRVERLVPRLLDEGLDPGESLPLDDASEVEAGFPFLDIGYAYGVAWH
jgi:hypothetical protein